MKAERNHFIDNDWIQGSGEPFSSLNPTTGETNWQGRAADGDDVGRVVGAAIGAFPGWSDLTPEVRIGYLEKFGAQVSARAQELAEAISKETGKPLWESRTETDAMVSKIPLSVQAYFERCREMTAGLTDARTVLRFKPHGVVAVFGPFNLPGHLPNGHMVPALLAGNTVVFKPSEQTPFVAQQMVELWEAAGLPKGVVNMVQGGRKTGMALASHPGLDGIYFTGSFATGHALHKSMAEHPEKILALEMGGNNPLVVHEVSDACAAAYVTILSAFITAGQRCSCARRLIVPRGSDGDRFIDHLLTAMGGIRVAAYTDVPEPFMGPVISEAAATTLLSAQESLLGNGALPLLPMRRLPGKGAFLTPGLLDVTPVKVRPDEEYFGPLLQLVRVEDFGEAVEEANKTKYGLAAGLLSDNRELYDVFLREVRAGVVNWNRHITGASGKLPFGGVKGSGNHRPSGYYAVDYCAYPVASIERDRVHMPKSLMPGIEMLEG